MYVGVAAAIAGQALAFRSVGLVVWLAVFLLAVVSFVKLYEEPTLSEQFGCAVRPLSPPQGARVVAVESCAAPGPR